MFIVIRKKSLLRSLVLALFLIFAGASLVTPHIALANESNLLYLYPAPGNNPVQPYGLFVSENPKQVTHPLNVWQQSFPNKKLVVAVPEEFTISQAMLAPNLGNYVLAKIRQRINDRAIETVNKGTDNKKNPPSGGGGNDKEVIFIERQVHGITEKIRVEVGEHLKNTDTFEKIYDSLNKGMLPKDTIEKEINKGLDHINNAPKPSPEAATMLLGGGMILSGLGLLGKILVFVL